MKMTGEELKQHVITKQKELNDMAAILKGHFIGIDKIIDRLMEHISTWYIFPELLQRPSIVCLWGLTGVGKTDLVRRLAGLLNMGNQFCEVSLRESSTSSYLSSIEEKLHDAGVLTTQPSILLLDEFQEFRTLERDGDDRRNTAYLDIWELLSDGQFMWTPSKREEVLELLMRSKTVLTEPALDDDDDIKPSVAAKAIAALAKKFKNKKKVSKASYDRPSLKCDDTPVRSSSRFSWWEAKRLKRIFGITEPIEVIMTWDDRRVYEIASTKLNSKELDKGVKYNSMLIFVCGNLDEAFQCAGEVDENDSDADTFYEHTKSINFLDIKSSLTRRFKPEQIARLGNNHIIYPSLTKASFEKIIDKELGLVIKGFECSTGLSVKINPSVPKFIYVNGVFPVSGTRPVFSTISGCFTNLLPGMAAETLKAGNKEMLVSYVNDEQDWYIFDSITGTRIKIEGCSSSIPHFRPEAQLKQICMHEAAHAVMRVALTKKIPIGMTLRKDGNAYVTPAYDGKEIFSFRDMINSVKISLAGIVIEKMLLGNNGASGGAYRDLRSATSLLRSMVASFGFEQFCVLYPDFESEPDTTNTQLYDNTNFITERVSRLMEDIKNEVYDHFNEMRGGKYWKLMGVIANELYTRKNLKFEDLKKIHDDLGIEYTNHLGDLERDEVLAVFDSLVSQ